MSAVRHRAACDAHVAQQFAAWPGEGYFTAQIASIARQHAEFVAGLGRAEAALRLADEAFARIDANA